MGRRYNDGGSSHSAVHYGSGTACVGTTGGVELADVDKHF